jgi:hypothetical protein
MEAILYDGFESTLLGDMIPGEVGFSMECLLQPMRYTKYFIYCRTNLYQGSLLWHYLYRIFDLNKRRLKNHLISFKRRAVRARASEQERTTPHKPSCELPRRIYYAYTRIFGTYFNHS